MKLLRFGPKGQEKPGMLDGAGRVRDLSAHVETFAGAAVGLGVIEGIRKIRRGVQQGSGEGAGRMAHFLYGPHSECF